MIKIVKEFITSYRCKLYTQIKNNFAFSAFVFSSQAKSKSVKSRNQKRFTHLDSASDKRRIMSKSPDQQQYQKSEEKNHNDM